MGTKILFPIFFLFLFSFIIVLLCVSVNAEINYIKNEWRLGEVDDTVFTDAVTTRYNTESKCIEIDKKDDWGNRTKDIDIKNVPVRYYKKIWNGPDSYILSEFKSLSSTLDLSGSKSKYVFSPYRFVDNTDIVCKVGFDTITYEGVNDIIEVTGFGNTFDTIYNADVANGWNQVFKLNDTTFHFDCIIYVGNSTNVGELIIENQVIVNIKSYSSNSQYCIRIQKSGSRCFMNNSLYKVNDSFKYYTRPFSINNFGALFMNDSSIICGHERSLIYLHNHSNDWVDSYINNSKFYKCGLYFTQPCDNVHVRNCFFDDAGYNIYNLPSIDLADCFFYDSDYVSINSNGGHYYNLSSINCNVDVNLGIDNRGINLYDYKTDKDGNKIQKSTNAGVINIYCNRYCSFRLVTNPFADVSLYYVNGTKVFNTTSDVNGSIGFYWVLCSTWNETLGTGTDCFYKTPFRLVISKTGFQTYNSTFNNSFEPMNYIIELQSGGGGGVRISHGAIWYLAIIAGFLAMAGFFIIRREPNGKHGHR